MSSGSHSGSDAFLNAEVSARLFLSFGEKLEERMSVQINKTMI